MSQKVAISSDVVIQEQQHEIDWLRNRLLLQGQAIKDLQAEVAEVRALLPKEPTEAQDG